MYRATFPALLLLSVLLAGCAAPRSRPADGLYAGELCVATGTQARNCGAADVSLSNRRAKVRVSDLVYDLLLEEGELELMLVHGTMLVDVFSAPYVWDGRYLLFVDQERRVHYRVRFADR